MAKKKPEAETDVPAAGNPGEKPTQKEAVKHALAAGKLLPTDGIVFIKDTFGIELNKGAFSTLKTQLKKAGGRTPAKRGRKPGPRISAVPVPVAARVNKPNANPAELVRGLRQLIGTFGAEAVRDMTAALTE